MFETGISKKANLLLKTLSNKDFIHQFYLAGGTALALRLGHRVSVDLDFFSKDSFHEKELQQKLMNLGNFTIQQMKDNTINAVLNDVKLSFMSYPYTELVKPDEYLGVKIASIEDIACMKIDDISSRGTKRDFVDLYFICQNGHSLKSLLKLFDKKYDKIKFNRLHLLKSLTYFEDAESHPMPQMNEKIDWDKVKLFFKQEVPQLV